MEVNYYNFTPEQIRDIATRRGIILNIPHNEHDLVLLLFKKDLAEKNILPKSPSRILIEGVPSYSSIVPYYPTVEELGLSKSFTLGQDLNQDLNLEQQSVVYKIKREGLYPYRVNSDKPVIELQLVEEQPLIAIEKYGRVTSGNNYWTMIEYIMMELGDPFVLRLATILGLENISMTDMYNLIWYINMRDIKIFPEIRLSYEEIRWITNLQPLELYNLVNIQGNYNGSNERIPMLFTALYGGIIPPFQPFERYNLVKDYPANITWILADKVHHITEDLGNFLPPYYYVSSKSSTSVESIMLHITQQNVDKLAKDYSVVFPLSITTPNAKVKYMLDEISRYDPILNRPANLPSPPAVLSTILQDAMKQLRQYTSQEIINAYWINGGWTDFKSLVRQIKEVKRGGSKWSIGHQSRCSNDQQNIQRGNTSYKQRIRDEKTSLEDPVLSYGVYNNYLCYRVSELVDTWQKSGGNLLPLVPYWTEQLLDPATDKQMERTFSDNSLKQLRDVVRNLDVKQSGSLIQLINRFVL